MVLSENTVIYFISPVTQEDREWTLNSLAQLGRFTGLGWILAPETPQV